ncbi:MAG: hypothetical protein N2109_05125 [Fimbriimonadales bacterium]|nr:hypothetical protein [Fimbriimonadales bacterium]
MELIELQRDHLERLVAWSALWLVLSAFHLARRPKEEALGAFWLVSGAWCAANLAIAALAWRSPGTDPTALRRLLWASEGFNLLCLVVGGLLARSQQPRRFGAGVAITLQAMALLVLDAVLLLQLPG